MSNFTLYVAKCQHGKTFISIQKIEHDISEDEEKGESIHCIFTMNTLLNNAQYAKRLEKIEEEYGEGTVCVFACKQNTSFKTVNTILQLQGLCLNKKTRPRIIVMCSNTKRFDDCKEFINVLNDNNTEIKRVFVHYDEVHSFVEKQRDLIEYIGSLNITNGSFGMTATPYKIFSKKAYWNKINIIELDKYNNKNYVGVKKMLFQINDYDTSDCIAYIKEVIENHPEIIGPNTRTFVPGLRRKESHDAIKAHLLEEHKNCVVCTINGTTKQVEWFDNGIHNIQELSEKYDPDDPEGQNEVCENIADIMTEYHLEERPYFITGYICLGMGQTLLSKRTGNFTHAIFSQDNTDNDTMYQLFGRTCGRMKNWEKYVQTKIYCSMKFKQIVRGMEKCAQHVAKDLGGQEITVEDYLEPLNEMKNKDPIRNNFKSTEKVVKEKTEEIEPIINKFSTFSEAKEYVKNDLGNKRGPNNPAKYINTDGFYECKIRSKKKVWSADEMYVERKCNIKNGAEYGFRYCYKNIHDKSTLEFWIIHYPK